jgi:hypothetical protein
LHRLTPKNTKARTVADLAGLSIELDSIADYRGPALN